jgi:hypothetical protein
MPQESLLSLLIVHISHVCVTTPNARFQPPLEAGATQERTL